MHAAINARRDALAALCRRLHVRRLKVFGSATRDADFDLNIPRSYGKPERFKVCRHAWPGACVRAAASRKYTTKAQRSSCCIHGKFFVSL